jgi:hypothetical protein
MTLVLLNGPTPYEAELKRRPHDPRVGGIEAVAESGTLNPVALASLIPNPPNLWDGLLLSWPIEESQFCTEVHRMTKQFDVAKIARLTEIKEEILDLLDEAASLVRGSSEEQRANHWYATVCTALDKDNTQGNDSTITMQETIDALKGDSGT